MCRLSLKLKLKKHPTALGGQILLDLQERLFDHDLLAACTCPAESDSGGFAKSRGDSPALPARPSAAVGSGSFNPFAAIGSGIERARAQPRGQEKDRRGSSTLAPNKRDNLVK